MNVICLHALHQLSHGLLRPSRREAADNKEWNNAISPQFKTELSPITVHGNYQQEMLISHYSTKLTVVDYTL